ncbi:MAG TPA: UDP-N-acetylmuramate--L-alanine ligase [Dissulfurispiraceae bacterium]|nr:UDP-N-acetylmuramate--L-alanine ligase [Dissulfurispiraceae bacterium]
MFNQYKIIHFVGIGGIGMSGIAEVLHNLGYEITGSDLRESDITSRLRKLGIKIFIGHDEKNIEAAHVVVTSSAVSSSNPEVTAAKDRGVPVIPRAEMLAELGRLKYGILVAGAHGKTTTTSLIATLLGEGGLDPTVVIGGKLKAFGSNARLGQGEFLVAEADESDGSFLKLSPAIAIITNIDREHMDYFKDIDTLKAAFLSFINKVPFYGVAIVCKENEHTREILPQIKRRVLTYGLSHDADMYARNIRFGESGMIFEAVFKGNLLGEFRVPILGVHNVLNSLAAILTAMQLQMPQDKIKVGLGGFGGIQRRFEFRGQSRSIKVYDDYGHHPVEIRAVLKAARECFPDNRIVVIFQPHRYTRTRDLMNDFALSFGSVDRLYLLDIYAASETPINGVDSAALLRKIQEVGLLKAEYINDRDELIKSLLSDLKNGDIVITLGAGDVYKIGEELLKAL